MAIDWIVIKPSGHTEVIVKHLFAVGSSRPGSSESDQCCHPPAAGPLSAHSLHIKGEVLNYGNTT